MSIRHALIDSDRKSLLSHDIAKYTSRSKRDFALFSTTPFNPFDGIMFHGTKFRGNEICRFFNDGTDHTGRPTPAATPRRRCWLNPARGACAQEPGATMNMRFPPPEWKLRETFAEINSPLPFPA